MGALQAHVRIEDIDGLFNESVKDILAAINADLEAVAQAVYENAKTSTAFKDKTGVLRRRIKLLKSLYPDGGYIVRSGAPHSHLIEFGHDLYIHGRFVGRVAPYPFLRPAYDKGVREAVMRFKGQAE